MNSSLLWLLLIVAVVVGVVILANFVVSMLLLAHLHRIIKMLCPEEHINVYRMYDDSYKFKWNKNRYDDY